MGDKNPPLYKKGIDKYPKVRYNKDTKEVMINEMSHLRQ